MRRIARDNVAPIRQSSPDSGLGFEANVPKTFEHVPSWYLQTPEVTERLPQPGERVGVRRIARQRPPVLRLGLGVRVQGLGCRV